VLSIYRNHLLGPLSALFLGDDDDFIPYVFKAKNLGITFSYDLNWGDHVSTICPVIFYCRFYFLDSISSYKYYGFKWKSQENLSSRSEKPLIEIFSWPSRWNGQLQGSGSNVFFVTFWLYLIQNKQKEYQNS
jgi:hypothetical protein